MGFVLFGLAVVAALIAVAVRCGAGLVRMLILTVLAPVMMFLGMWIGVGIVPMSQPMMIWGALVGAGAAWWVSGLGSAPKVSRQEN